MTDQVKSKVSVEAYGTSTKEYNSFKSTHQSICWQVFIEGLGCPVTHGPHAAQDGYEGGLTQNHKFTY